MLFYYWNLIKYIKIMTFYLIGITKTKILLIINNITNFQKCIFDYLSILNEF